MPFVIAGLVIIVGGLLTFGGAGRKFRTRRQVKTRIANRLRFWRWFRRRTEAGSVHGTN